jgi:hypothetical protein
MRGGESSRTHTRRIFWAAERKEYRDSNKHFVELQRNSRDVDRVGRAEGKQDDPPLLALRVREGRGKRRLSVWRSRGAAADPQASVSIHSGVGPTALRSVPARPPRLNVFARRSGPTSLGRAEAGWQIGLFRWIVVGMPAPVEKRSEWRRASGGVSFSTKFYRHDRRL